MHRRNQIGAEAQCEVCDFIAFDSGGTTAYDAGYRHWKSTGHSVNMEIVTSYIIGQDKPRMSGKSKEILNSMMKKAGW